MASQMYDWGVKGFIDGLIDWNGDDFYVALVDTGTYTVDLVNDRYLSDLSGVVATSDILTGTQVTSATATEICGEADYTYFTAVSGSTAEALVVYKDTGVSSTSPLVCYIDTAVGLPVTPAGADIQVNFTDNVVFRADLTPTVYDYVDIDRVGVPEPFYVGSNTTAVSTSGYKVAGTFQAPKTGTIDRVCFATGWVTTGGTVDVRLETVHTDGFPTGTLAGTNSNGSCVVAGSDDHVWKEVTLTTGCAVTKGDLLAIVVVLGSPGSMEIRSCTVSGSGGTRSQPGAACYYVGSWAFVSGAYHFQGAVRYSDGSYPRAMSLEPFVNQVTATSYNSGSTPDERGMLFVPPYDCKIGGAWGLSTHSNNFVVNLYDSSNTVLASFTKDRPMGYDTSGVVNVAFSDGVEVLAGDTYRIAFAPSSGSNIAVHEQPIPGIAIGQRAIDWGFTATYRTNAGAWTQDTALLYNMGIYVTAIKVEVP